MVDGLWTDLNKKSLHNWQNGPAYCSPPLKERSPTAETVWNKNGPHCTITSVEVNDFAHHNIIIILLGYVTAEKHPYMYMSRMEDAIPKHLRILALLSANTAAGM